MAPLCNELMPIFPKTHKLICDAWSAKLPLNVKKSHLNLNSECLDIVLQASTCGLRNYCRAYLRDAPINDGDLVIKGWYRSYVSCVTYRVLSA